MLARSYRCLGRPPPSPALRSSLSLTPLLDEHTGSSKSYYNPCVMKRRLVVIQGSNVALALLQDERQDRRNEHNQGAGNHRSPNCGDRLWNFRTSHRPHGEPTGWGGTPI